MSWLDTPGSAPGIGQADIDRALAAGRSMAEIQAEINRAQGAGVEIGSKAQAYATPTTSYTLPEFQAAQTASTLRTQSQIEDVRQAGATERLKFEVENRIPEIQALSQGKLDLQAVVNAGYKNIANIERGADMMRSITSMFNF